MKPYSDGSNVIYTNEETVFCDGYMVKMKCNDGYDEVQQEATHPKIPEIQKLQAQVNNLEMQISDYQQIVKELSDKLELLKKFV